MPGFEGGTPEAPVTDQRAADEDRPQYGVDPGDIFFQAEIGEIPEGEGPDDEDITADDDRKQNKAKEDGHNSGGEAFEKEHAPVLVVRVGAPGGCCSWALD